MSFKILSDDDLRQIQLRAQLKLKKAKEELFWEALHPSEKECLPSNRLSPINLSSTKEGASYKKSLKKDPQTTNNLPLKKSSQCVNFFRDTALKTSSKTVPPSKPSTDVQPLICNHEALHQNINHLKQQIDKLTKLFSKKHHHHSRKSTRVQHPLKIERISSHNNVQADHLEAKRQRFLRQALQHLTLTTHLSSASSQDKKMEALKSTLPKGIENSEDVHSKTKQIQKEVAQLPEHYPSKTNRRKSHHHLKIRLHRCCAKHGQMHMTAKRRKSSKVEQLANGILSIQGKEDDLVEEYLDEMLNEILSSLPEKSHHQIASLLFPSSRKNQLMAEIPSSNTENQRKESSFEIPSPSLRVIKESSTESISGNESSKIPLPSSPLQKDPIGKLDTAEKVKAKESNHNARLLENHHQKSELKSHDSTKERATSPIHLFLHHSQKTSILKQKDNYASNAEDKMRCWRLTEEMTDLILESTLHSIAHEFHTFSESLINKLYEQEFTPKPDVLSKG